MANGFIEMLRTKIIHPPTILFPESDQEKILKAARIVKDQSIGHPIVMGNPEEIMPLAEKAGVSLEGITVADTTSKEITEALAERFASENEGYTAGMVRRMFRDPLNLGAAMVRYGEADCLAAGVSHTTGEVIMASQMFIGMQEGVSTVSSLGIVEVPGYEGSEGKFLVIADCAVCAFPTPAERADIAITTADTVKNLLGWEPRAALLSFSTKGSADHERIHEILETLDIVKKRRPDILIDGELQLDSAISPEVAKKKAPGESAVAGKANILIFPDLNAGNIGVKIFQRFAGATAHGPLLQGFSKPVTDFSRGAPIEEMLGAITMLAVRAQKGRL